jgi:hypothetical protein
LEINRKYLVAVALLVVLAVVFGVVGTVAPPLAESATPSASSPSSSSSVAHFTNPPTYDSGWVNITTKAGQYVTLKHSLNTTNVVVDVTGKQSLDANGGALAWNKTYGGTNDEGAYPLVQTVDGGYALAGFTRSYGAGGWDVWLVKTDSSGNMQWSKTYGGTGDEGAYSMVQTTDGGYALAGSTNSYGAGSNDFWLVKTDGAGNPQWTKTYGETGDDYAYSIVQTSDGGYALAGCGFANLVKTDSSGNMQWNKKYTGNAYSLVQTVDGGYALAGFTHPYASFDDFWLVKTDSLGNTQWSKTYGGTNIDEAYCLVQTSDGGYALAGYTYYSEDTQEDFWLVKTDSSGNMQWNKTYGGRDTDEAYSLVQTVDGGYALAGYTLSFGASLGDLWLVKTDAGGNTQWNRQYGGPKSECALSLTQTADGGYALAGFTNSYDAGGDDFWLVKVNGEMNLEHQINLGDMEKGLAWTGLTNNTIILYRGKTDLYWNYVRVRIWLIKEPTWIYGDINMDGVVDAKDLYILSRNYGKTFSLLSLSGVVGIASVHTVKTRKKKHN